MNPFPFCIIALSVLASVWYAGQGDWRFAIYYLAAAVINAAVIA